MFTNLDNIFIYEKNVAILAEYFDYFSRLRKFVDFLLGLFFFFVSLHFYLLFIYC